MASRPTDAIAAVAAIAAPQFHLFTTAQAEDVGLGRHQLARGRYRRVLPRVWTSTVAPSHEMTAAMAGLLSAGDRAVLSHLTSARIGGLDGIPPHRHVHLSGPINGRRSCDWLRVHRRVVPPETITTTGPLVHTTHLRTLRDSCSLLDELHIERMLESVLRRGTDLRLVQELAESSRFWGRKRLARVLARRPTGAPPTGSELETRLHQLYRWHGLPAFVRQYEVVVDGEVIAKLDGCWPEYRAFVEADGVEFHDRPEALLYDRHRQNEVVVALGYRPLRFTWTDVTRHQLHTVRTTARALHAGGWRS